jgi:solute carrier family 25 (mitochondrial citrate transporter), member 1
MADTSHHPKKRNPLTPLSAGCIAGAIEATAVWPLEYIKTQLQLQSKRSTANAKLSAPPYTGMISGLRYTVQTTGFFSLYRGLAPTLIGSVPKAGIRFGLNAVIKDALRDKNTGLLTPSKNFLAGLGAGVAEAVIIVAPVETVKTKCIQLNLPFVSGLKQIIRNEGIIKGVYQGTLATAFKQGTNQGFRFMWFNEYKRIMTNDGQAGPLSAIGGLIGGMSAGCFSTLCNNPFDVVKTRLRKSITVACIFRGPLSVAEVSFFAISDRCIFSLVSPPNCSEGAYSLSFRHSKGHVF